MKIHYLLTILLILILFSVNCQKKEKNAEAEEFVDNVETAVEDGESENGEDILGNPYQKNWDLPKQAEKMIIEAVDETIGPELHLEFANNTQKKIYGFINRFTQKLKRNKIEQVKPFFTVAAYANFYESLNRPDKLKVFDVLKFKIGLPQRKAGVYTVKIKYLYSAANSSGDLKIVLKKNQYLIDSFSTNLFSFLVSDDNL